MRKLLITFFAVLCTACVQQSFDQFPYTFVDPQGAEYDVRLEIADTPSLRQQGLMFHEQLPADTGMIFIFDDEQVRNFWMKNTLVALDALFFDAEGNWVSTQSMLPCEADPCPGYSSEAPAQYVIELPYGWAHEKGVRAGWRVDLSN